MAVIRLSIVVGNLDEVLATFDVIKVHRSTAGELGPFTELSVPATRPVLESGKVIYDFVDDTGDASYHYRSSYFNTISGLESSLSDVQQGDGSGALDIITVEEVKTNYLFGLDLTNDQGEEYPDSLYEHFISSAVSWLEHRLDIPILPKVVDDERHDYLKEEYRQFIWLHLDYYPLIAVESVKLYLPGEQLVATFDDEWIHIQKDGGVVQLMPGPGTAGALVQGVSGAWMPLLYSSARMIPDAFRVKYTAGFDTVPPIIKDLIGKIASFGPLNIAGDLLGGAGIASQSIGIDGLNTTFNTTSSSTSAGYGARLIQYQKEIKEVVPTLQRYYKGVRMRVA